MSGCSRVQLWLRPAPHEHLCGRACSCSLWCEVVFEQETWKSPVIPFRPSFTVCTAHSTKPFEAGWKGAVCMWWMPFCCMNSVNSSLVNDVPLSVTRVSGSPWTANTALSLSMVVGAVMLPIMWASIHLECASTIIRNICPMKGRAKSKCEPCEANHGPKDWALRL